MGRMEPLAERLRPRSLDEVLGQPHLTGPRGLLRRMLESRRLASMVLFGPPGTGKTTLARLLAEGVGKPFLHISAVEAGLKEVRQAVERARREGGLVLFLDEVHRFNKAQQDALLPHLESGLLTLIGATAENPAFELTPALRSRLRFFPLRPLSETDLLTLLKKALTDPRGLPGTPYEEGALKLLAQAAGGDARFALNTLELAASFGRVDEESVREALGSERFAMDRGGDHFYDLVSALHKSLRGSHVDASLYYLARLLRGGADPRYLARRLIRVAAEDVGLADPLALRLAVAAKEAYEALGSPEGELALVEAAIYLALAPKSNSVYAAWQRAEAAAKAHPEAPVPLHLRNAPTPLAKALGHGRGYAYYHEDKEGSFAQAYLPEGLEGLRLYEATGEGWEERVRERLKALRERFRATP
ncbi:replication-associated recombination protein A [Thermus tengchongensis]|uniref:Replication-associated recombination protein A n=1 Tax=Thermus tengchongensis TaxID=1214928 RepID=A0A4Y9FC34_9DEIN|nr:replication-associated recombination protein A [Thermus tengchongensis]TFU25758.1 replication-associated recombination protein A [Thermus tengchongensis]